MGKRGILRVLTLMGAVKHIIFIFRRSWPSLLLGWKEAVDISSLTP